METKLWDGGPFDQGSVQSFEVAGPGPFDPEEEDPGELGATVEGDAAAGDEELEALEEVLEVVAELDEPRESVT